MSCFSERCIVSVVYLWHHCQGARPHRASSYPGSVVCTSLMPSVCVLLQATTCCSASTLRLTWQRPAGGVSYATSHSCQIQNHPIAYITCMPALHGVAKTCCFLSSKYMFLICGCVDLRSICCCTLLLCAAGGTTSAYWPIHHWQVRLLVARFGFASNMFVVPLVR
jgi:hypothetical protein